MIETIDAEAHLVPPPKEPDPKLSIPQILEIEKLAEGQSSFLQRILNYYQKEKLAEIDAKHFDVIKNGLINLRKSEDMDYASA